MKILIVGRTGTGKDTLKEILEKNFNWKFVKSMTTRPRRHPDEDTHIFLTKEAAAAYRQEDKAAWTEINGYEYFTTKQQVEECDAYIIDPKGIETLSATMPDEQFRIVYLVAIDEATRQTMALKRAANPETEINIYKARNASEDDQFTAFEEMLHNKNLNYPNCQTFTQFKNTFVKSDMEQLAVQLELSRRFLRNVEYIITDLITANIMRHDDAGNPVMLTDSKDAENSEFVMPIGQLADCLEQSPTLLGDMTIKWLSMCDIDLSKLHEKDDT